MENLIEINFCFYRYKSYRYSYVYSKKYSNIDDVDYYKDIKFLTNFDLSYLASSNVIHSKCDGLYNLNYEIIINGETLTDQIVQADIDFIETVRKIFNCLGFKYFYKVQNPIEQGKE